MLEILVIAWGGYAVATHVEDCPRLVPGAAHMIHQLPDMAEAEVYCLATFAPAISQRPIARPKGETK